MSKPKYIVDEFGRTWRDPDAKPRVKQVPFPDFSPKSGQAAYLLDKHGRVWRNDGLLMIPAQRARAHADTCPALFIRLGGGRITRSLPKAVWDAFGDPDRLPDDGSEWVPWQNPDAPIDELTKLRRCGVKDIFLVPRVEAQQYATEGKIPETLVKIV